MKGIVVKIPEFSLENLIELILNQPWHKECEIIPNYMPPYPNKDTRPSTVVVYKNDHSDVFLRYSKGPRQGFSWDIYGDDMHSVELAIIALSTAPLPMNYRKAEYPAVYKLSGIKKENLK